MDKRGCTVVGVDIMDLPKTESGNKHVVVFQDFLSKWPLVFPVPDQKALRLTQLDSRLVNTNLRVLREVHFHCTDIGFFQGGHSIWSMPRSGKFPVAVLFLRRESNQDPIAGLQTCRFSSSRLVIVALVSLLSLANVISSQISCRR